MTFPPCTMLLQVKHIRDKLSTMCVVHIIVTKRCDIKSFMLQG